MKLTNPFRELLLDLYFLKPLYSAQELSYEFLTSSQPGSQSDIFTSPAANVGARL